MTARLLPRARHPTRPALQAENPCFPAYSRAKQPVIVTRQLPDTYPTLAPWAADLAWPRRSCGPFGAGQVSGNCRVTVRGPIAHQQLEKSRFWQPEAWVSGVGRLRR